jgi:uncharacterized membrane protein YheB (UPF0754 family)
MANVSKNNVLDTIQKYWIVILGIFIIAPYLKSFYAKMGVKNEVDKESNAQDLNSQINALDNPDLQELEANKLAKNLSKSQRERIKADVKQYIAHTGVNYAWYEVKGLTENDKEAADILCRWVQHLTLFSSLYYNVYTKSRNLKTDFYKLIDTADQKRVYAQQIKFKTKFF